MKPSHKVHGKLQAVLVHNPQKSGCLKALRRSSPSSLLFAESPEIDAAVNEHLNLIKLLDKSGVETIELFDLLSDDDKELFRDNPNLIYTRDPFITLPWEPKVAIAGKMARKIRFHETKILSKISSLIGLDQTIYLPEETSLEGGDVLPVNLDGKRVIFIHTSGRTHSKVPEILTNLPDILCDEIVEIQTIGSVLHLDSVMGLAGSNILVYEPEAIKKVLVHSLGQVTEVKLEDYMAKHEIVGLPVSPLEAERFQATNFINIDDQTVIAFNNCLRVVKEMSARGIKVLSFSGTELSKGRGGPRCLTRPIYSHFNSLDPVPDMVRTVPQVAT